MSSVPPTPRPNAQILDEASAWFVEFSEGEVSLESREGFSNWLRASPEHVRAYLSVSATFDDLGQLAFHRCADADALLAHVRAEGEGNVVPLSAAGTRGSEARGSAAVHASAGSVGRTLASANSKRRSARAPLTDRRRVPLVAGITTIALASAIVAIWLNSQKGLYSTGTGEQRVVNLADGSTIELNAESKIRVHLGARERTVDLLEGQALFHVAKDTSRAFIVHSDSTSVRAVGTQFDVNRETSDTVVSVLEGRVAVARSGLDKGVSRAVGESAAGSASADRPSDDQLLYLSAGEQAIVTAQAASKPAHPDVAAATAWRERKLIFASSPLTEVAGEYNRYHEKRLRVADPALNDFRISGVFSAADATSLIEFLKAQPNIQVEEKDDEIILQSR